MAQAQRTPTVDEQALEQIAAYMDDDLLYFRECATVRDHNTSQLLPFNLRRGQRILHNVAEKQSKTQGYIRIFLYKSRRFGGSTYVELRLYKKTSMQYNKNAFIVGHEEASTATLFSMAKLCHEKNPLAPATRASNAQELIFDNKDGTGLKSAYKLATAKNVDAGRSQGIHYGHWCLHGDSLIVLADGSSCKIKDISVGDLVITGSGESAEVSQVFKSAKKQTYKVDTWLNNQPIFVSKDHKIFTDSGIKKCKDLTKKDWVLVPSIPITNEITEYTFNLPNIKRKQGGGLTHIETATIKLTEDFGYAVGYYLAEGCVKRQKGYDTYCNVHFAYHKDETFIERVYDACKEYITSRNDYTDKTNRKRTYFYGTFFAELIKDLCGRTSEKHIPYWFFKTNKEFLYGVLNGYLDGDGSKTGKNIISATCIRERIARQIRRICISLGLGVPGFNYYADRARYTVKTSPIYKIGLTGETLKRYLNQEVIEINQATKYKKIGDKFFVRVKGVSEHTIAHTFDIEVNHPDHNFETTIGVVSNSEEAYWPDNARELITGLLACFPEPPTGTEAWRESTANGCGNTFHVGCVDSYCEGKYPFYEEEGIPFAWGNPESDWVVVFIPWFIDESLSKPFDNAAAREEFAKKIEEKQFDRDNLQWKEKEEKVLQRRFNLTLEQLHWREWCIKNKCLGSVDTFHQEYPATFEEGFLAQGTNVFSRPLCDDLQAQCLAPLEVGDPYRLGGLVRMKRNQHGKFTVWEHHKETDGYFITVDVAGGLKQNVVGVKRKKKDEPDKTNIDVWNHRTGMQAAQWNGHIDYDLVADMVMMIGELYARRGDKEVKLPPACVELNNHGFTVVRDLTNMKYPQYGNQAVNVPGWLTNKRTKPQMIDGFKEAVRDNTLKLNSIPTISEMRTYVEEGGHFGAAPGCNDDRVMTAAMASELVKTLPRSFGGSNGRSGVARFTNLDDSSSVGSERREYEEFYA